MERPAEIKNQRLTTRRHTVSATLRRCAPATFPRPAAGGTEPRGDRFDVPPARGRTIGIDQDALRAPVTPGLRWTRNKEEFVLVVFEFAALTATVVLAVLWIRDPSGNYEPWTVLCGVVCTVTEIYRRFSGRSPDATFPGSKKEMLAWFHEHGPVKPLAELLPRALQLAQKVQNQELEHWARMELYGYNSDGGMTAGDTVPEYRAIGGRYIDVHGQILHIDDPRLEFINAYRLRLGVAQLEELSRKTEMQNIQDPGYLEIIRRNLGVDVYRFCFSPVELVAVLQNIRKALLDKISALA